MDEHEQEKGNRSQRKAFFVLLMFIMLFAAFLDILWPYRLTIPSPTGQYALEQRYLDMGGWGYRGRTYLLANGTYYRIDDIGPGHVSWTDDKVFSVYGENYAVSDFTGPYLK